MRRLVLMLLTIVAIVALPSVLQAEDQKRPGPPHDPATLFKRLDQNNDGKVTADEIPDGAPGHLKEALKRADKNQDKTITSEEFRAMVAQRRPDGHPGRRPGGPPSRGMHGRQDGRPGGPPSRGMHGRPDGCPGGPPSRGMHGRPGGCPGGPPSHGMHGRPDGCPGGPPSRGMHGRPGGAPQAGSRGRMPDPKAIFIRLDRDKDKKLSLEEFTTGMRMMHQRHQGPPHDRRPSERRGDPMHDRLKAADKNKDGKISKEEAPEMLKTHFERIDANKDGQLEPTELRKAHEAFRGRSRGETPPRRAEAAKQKIEPRKKAIDEKAAEKKKPAPAPKKEAPK